LKQAIKGQKGQTVLEYILMLLVMVSIITSILSYIRTKYLGDATKCDKPAYSKTLLCKINNIIQPHGNGKKFQYYPIKK
jgi:uncharacterized protein (UPF0333 family)